MPKNHKKMFNIGCEHLKQMTFAQFMKIYGKLNFIEPHEKVYEEVTGNKVRSDKPIILKEPDKVVKSKE